MHIAVDLVSVAQRINASREASSSHGGAEHDMKEGAAAPREEQSARQAGTSPQRTMARSTGPLRGWRSCGIICNNMTSRAKHDPSFKTWQIN